MTASSVSSQAVITRSNMWGTNEQSVFGTRSRTIDRIPFAALHVLIAVMNHIYFGLAKGNYHGSVVFFYFFNRIFVEPDACPANT